MFRTKREGHSQESKDECYQRTMSAILVHAKSSVVLMVHLRVSTETTLRSKRQVNGDTARLPLESEETECAEMCDEIGVRGLKLMTELRKDLPLVQLLLVDNSEDGGDEVEETSCRITRFIHDNLWQRATMPQQIKFSTTALEMVGFSPYVSLYRYVSNDDPMVGFCD